MTDTQTLSTVIAEREVVREELNRVKGKQARLKRDADGQRRQLEALHEREKGIVDAFLGRCDNCVKKARVIIQKTSDGHLLRMCYHHADMHWTNRIAHTNPRAVSKPVERALVENLEGQG